MAIDITLTPLQNTRFHNKYKGLIPQLVKDTFFSETQITCYLLIYYKLALVNGPKADYITQGQLAFILQTHHNLNERIIINNIIRVISKGSNITITPIEFIKLLAIFVTDSLEDQIEFCFKVYDIHQRGFLERFVITTFIQNYFIGDDEESDDYTFEMMEILMQLFDNDKDGMISFDDYRTTILKTPKLMQFLGICIPPIQDGYEYFIKKRN